MFTDSVFDKTEMAREKMVIREEMKMVADSPDDDALDTMTALVMKGTPLANDILGTPSTLEKITRNKLVEYIDRQYTRDSIVFSIERLYADGPVPRETAAALDQFRPHLARASIIAARLGLERARASVAALELIGLPAAIITGRHSVLAANELITACGAFDIGAFDRVRLSDPMANKRLQLHLDVAGDAGLSFPIRATAGRPAFVAHLVPLRRAGLDIFSGAAQLFYLTEVGRGAAPSAAILEALFDLSPAEAKVTRLLLSGGTVAGIASTHKIRPETVRGQLKSVFAKTGVRRQAELIQLLGGIQSPGMPGVGL